MGPDFQKPAAPGVSSYTEDVVRSHGQTLQAGADIPPDWWTLLRTPALDSLVRQALANNPDLQSASAALRVAMEGLKAGQGLQYPTVGLGLAANRNKDSAALSPVPASSALFYSLYQTQLSVSWSPDIWGGTRRQIEALQAQADGQRYQLQVRAFDSGFQCRSCRHSRSGATRANRSHKRHYWRSAPHNEIAQRQQDLGQIAGGDVAAQRVLLAQAEATLPPLEKQLAMQRDQLKALVGKLPAESPARNIPPGRLYPAECTAFIAAITLGRATRRCSHGGRKPSCRQRRHRGRHREHASQSDPVSRPRVGCHKPGNVFAPGNEFWNLGAGLAQPLFDGGTLRHRKKAAEAAYDVAAAQYRSTVIAAFQNVADTLHAIAADSKTERAAAMAEQEAARSLALPTNNSSSARSTAAHCSWRSRRISKPLLR